MQDTQVWSLDWEDPPEKERLPTPVFSSGESQGQRSLVGYSPWQDWVTNIPSLMMILLQVFRKSTLWDKCLTLLKSKLLEKIIWLSLWHRILSRTESQMVFTQISYLLSAFLVSFFQPRVLHIMQTFTLWGTQKARWFLLKFPISYQLS